MRHVHLIISGDVQGVSYRYFVKERAEELGVTGYVRNVPNGTVEIEAEAEDSTLQLFLDRCREGSAFAKVDRMDVVEGAVRHFQEFRITG